jgi:hypothetical protein
MDAGHEQLFPLIQGRPDDRVDAQRGGWLDLVGLAAPKQFAADLLRTAFLDAELLG